MPAEGGIVIEGLKEFRRDLRRARDGATRELSKAIRAMGEPVLADLREIPARRSGRLARGYRIRVRATSGHIVNVELYGAGAEWGMHGKWAGFRRYGGKGRFAWQAVQDNAEAIALIGLARLRLVVSIHGWAKEA